MDPVTLFLLATGGYPITLSALLSLYVVIDRAGGSAALGILTVAFILDNAGASSSLAACSSPCAYRPCSSPPWGPN